MFTRRLTEEELEDNIANSLLDIKNNDLMVEKANIDVENKNFERNLENSRILSQCCYKIKFSPLKENNESYENMFNKSLNFLKKVDESCESEINYSKKFEKMKKNILSYYSPIAKDIRQNPSKAVYLENAKKIVFIHANNALSTPILVHEFTHTLNPKSPALVKEFSPIFNETLFVKDLLNVDNKNLLDYTTFLKFRNNYLMCSSSMTLVDGLIAKYVCGKNSLIKTLCELKKSNNLYFAKLTLDDIKKNNNFDITTNTYAPYITSTALSNYLVDTYDFDRLSHLSKDIVKNSNKNSFQKILKNSFVEEDEKEILKEYTKNFSSNMKNLDNLEENYILKNGLDL